MLLSGPQSAACVYYTRASARGPAYTGSLRGSTQVHSSPQNASIWCGLALHGYPLKTMLVAPSPFPEHRVPGHRRQTSRPVDRGTGTTALAASCFHTGPQDVERRVLAPVLHSPHTPGDFTDPNWGPNRSGGVL